jgi:hypothetical protein
LDAAPFIMVLMAGPLDFLVHINLLVMKEDVGISIIFLIQVVSLIRKVDIWFKTYVKTQVVDTSLSALLLENWDFLLSPIRTHMFLGWLVYQHMSALAVAAAELKDGRVQCV